MSTFSHYYRRGVIISQDLESDRKVERKLLRCCHCSITWAPAPNSGAMRGFCQRCMGDLCGRPECVQRGCVDWRYELEQMETGIPWALVSESRVPIVVSVPTLPFLNCVGERIGTIVPTAAPDIPPLALPSPHADGAGGTGDK